MITVSRAPILALLFLASLPVAARAQILPPPCPTLAPDGFHKQTACSVTIDRTNPASPATVVVRAGTAITIELIHARGNETVVFTPTTTQTPPVDIAAAFLKSAITPLQSLIINQANHIGAHALTSSDIIRIDDPIVVKLNALIGAVEEALGVMADASVRLSCFEAYRGVQGQAKNYSCSDALLTPATYSQEKNHTITALITASKAPLPLATIQDVDPLITRDVADSLREPNPNTRATDLRKDDQYLSTEAVIKTALGDAQKTQTTLLEAAEQLTLLVDAPTEATFTISQAKNFNSSVTVVAQEALSKATTTVGTVVVNWQANQWEISTGIMFSTAVGRSFSNAPLIVSGVPQLDSGGKNLTVVEEADTHPTVLVPLVMVNYRIRGLSNFHWENRCPGHCAVLLSGGVGLNVTTANKNTEFTVGPSFQLGSVIFTPGIHITRNTELTQGVKPGDQLGSSPPSPLPTATHWTGKFGFGISYVMPF